MEATLKKNFTTKEIERWQNESDMTKITDMFSKYFDWVIQNNIEESQRYWKFWNLKFLSYTLPFFKK